MKLNGQGELLLLKNQLCALDENGHCITCSDEALPASVVQVDRAVALAQVEIAGTTTEVDISLLDNVTVGDWLLVHGGVALEHLVE
jgi:hydrogenase assembly chaperone HypC/HupF